jgi:RNA 3'-terminal phosphate cyclase (ATP)
LQHLRIDGSLGEGGGQILRSAVSFSAIIGLPVEVVNIRAGRPNPGLRPQHLSAVKAVADLFSAKVENLKIGSDWIRFAPTRFSGASARIDIGTAGSIPMVLLTVIPAVSLSGTGVDIEIAGGTDVKASPTIDYLRHVVAAAFRIIGIRFDIEVIKRGYYPKGGGLVRAEISSCKSPETVDLLNIRSLEPKVASVCSSLPKHVAERQISSALIWLEKSGVKCNSYSASFESSLSPGSSALVYSVSDFGPYIGGDSIGEIGKRAEDVGQEAAQRFLESHLAGMAVDPFLSDMLVIPLALSRGRSRFRVDRVTAHLETNLVVASKMVGCSYKINRAEKGYIVEIEGARI